ncbi:quinol monooxygenase YgiN [Rhizobium sp. SG_E_25_P2]|uniref:putative quinol monooxygenase n=1 Tax=Rhizobium sp. SG_E_25_P2 TaxID=2879942 RepID=UPI002474F116|nr:putative quinol monooxygenase [Rhizobium sp. SG_E_25_P2]MDH6267697.1 quinol monooxygenase YgiN [Rhizobium sp. SG_E_25_P2]
MTDSRVIRMAEIEIDPRALDDYKRLLAEEIDLSLEREPGVLQLEAASLRDAPHLFRLLEVYASPEAYQAHLKTEHFLAYKAATAAMVVSLRLIEADALRIGNSSRKS